MNPESPLLLYILLFSSLLIECSGALSSDGEALINFRTAIISSDGVLTHWRPEDPDPCGWKGVQCDPKTRRVTSLSLPQHKLSGPISPDIGKLEHLQFLALYSNNFYGKIPAALANCTELQTLYLQGNYLSDLIPSELGNLLGLENLDISSNSLDGSIPQSLGMLSKLLTLNVSSNFLSGAVPSDGVLSNFNESSFVGNQQLCGKQVSKKCSDVGEPGSQSSGSGNQGNKKNSGRLFVSASATVGALLLVALMCFWGCFLYKKLGKKNVGSLAMDVGGEASVVMFHGDLPYSSKDIIKKLENLNEEHIIGTGGFATVYKLGMDDGSVFALKRIMKLNEGFDRFFERELEILGSIKHRHLVNLRGYCKSSTSKLLIYDFLSGGSLDEALHATYHPKYSLKPVHEAEPYKSALKKGSNTRKDAVLELIATLFWLHLFLAGTFPSSNGSHMSIDWNQNNLFIFTLAFCFQSCYFAEVLSFHVYTTMFMMFDAIIAERSEQLDLETRLNIIMGAAKGLAYLHHDCSPRIIHRDIKSSNILLDGNMEARVSDFGLAKLLEDEESHITTIVAGTFGYLAPEYMRSGRATEKTDVYSFGVLVLELLSGKRPTDASFIEKGLNIVGWFNILVKESRQREIVDPFCREVNSETLDALLSLADQCVSSVPDDRPTMHRVVQVLESEVMTPCPSEFYESNSD